MKKPLPRPTPKREVSKIVPAAQQKELFAQLTSQVEALAARLDALRAQGADKTPEFRQVEMMLHAVQDKLVLAQAKLK